MSEKVTISFGSLRDDDSIIIESPIEIYKIVEKIEELYNLPNEEDFPQHEVVGLEDENNQPLVVVYVRDISDSPHYRGGDKGAYFKYNYFTGSWKEILVGSHSHSNKQLLDKLHEGDVGSWINITKQPTVKISDTPPYNEDNEEGQLVGYDANTGSIHFDRVEEKLYSAVRERSGKEFITNWFRIPVAVRDAGEFPNNANEKDVLYLRPDENNEEQIYVFTGVKAGETRVLIMEVKETGMVGDYDLKWGFMPEMLPDPILDSEKRLYLSVDKDGNKSWVNDFIPGQSFTILENPEITGKDLIYINIDMDPKHDEVILFADKFFVQYDEILYSEETKELRIRLKENPEGHKDSLTGFILRNTIQAVLSELAEEYVRKDELGDFPGGSGGSGVTQQDLNKKADRDHIHTGYSKIGHDHDDRYAKIEHTHEEYMTEGSILRLMAKDDWTTPDIIKKLLEIQNTLDTEELKELLISKEQFKKLQNKVSDLNEDISDLSTQMITSDRVLTEFPDSYRQARTLDDVLRELFEYIELNNLKGLQADEIEFGEDYEVTNGVGYYDEGSVIPAGSSVQTVLKNILRKGYDYKTPSLEFEDLQRENYVEMGVVNIIEFNPTVDFAHSGGLKLYRIINKDTGFIYHESLTSVSPRSIKLEVSKKDINIKVELRYKEGEIQENDPTGFIREGSIIKHFTFKPRRAIYYGVSESDTHIKIREESIGKKVIQNYRYIDFDLTYPKGSKIIFIATPSGHNIKLNKISYTLFNQDITHNFKIIENVPLGLGFETNIEEDWSIPYNVYVFEIPKELEHDLTINIKK